MEHRFGVKDFFLFLLVGVLIVLVALAMVQYDRQWGDVQEIKTSLKDQAGDLNRLRGELNKVRNSITNQIAELGERTVAVGPTTRAMGSQTRPALARTLDPNDPFVRMKAARAKEDFAEGDWLVEGVSKVAKLTPLISRDATASNIQEYVLEKLALRDPDTLEYRGRLAKGWQISDNGMRITFQIREDVTFSDGEPLTADDVVFTFNFIMNEKIATPRFRAYFKMIDRVEKKDAHEVTFIFKEPYFEAFALAGEMPIMPRHYYSKIDPETFNASTGLLVGSGPYVLSAGGQQWKPGMLIELARNSRYWGTPPAFERIQFVEYTNEVARITAFRNGKIDTFGALPEQYVEMIKDQALSRRTQRFEFLSPRGGYRYIAWNQRKNGQPTFFADKRVRQAMTMLIDRQRLIQENYLGYAIEATGPFNPNGKQCNPNVRPWPADVGRAKALLAEAGFKPGSDEVLLDRDGKRFDFAITYPSGTASFDNQALFIKDSLARAGIVCRPDPLEWSMFTERLRNKNFEAITLMWTADIEIDIYQAFHSDQMVAGGDNFISYKNPELDALINKARRTVKEDERMPLWHRCHEILHEDQPYTFLFFPRALAFIDKRIHNVFLTKRLGLNGRSEWYVPLEEQKWK